MRSWRPRAVHRTIVAAFAALLVLPSFLAALSAPAFAAPSVSTPSIRAKQAEVAAAQQRLSDLADVAEQRYQDYQDVTDKLDAVRSQIASNQADLDAADAALAAAQQRLGERADSIYRTGPAAFLELLLGTESVGDFLSRMDIMAAIGNSDAGLVSAVRDARFKVEQAAVALQRREAQLAELRIQASQRKAAAVEAFAAQRDYVRSIRGELAKLIKAEEARQAKLAAERAAQARAAAQVRARALAAARAGTKSSGDGGGGGGGGDGGGGLPAPTNSPSQIVQVALQYIGVPYVWGGESPDGFDCSGLAQYVYAKCGISIPRSSVEQFASGTHIPADRPDLLEPGNLVFFGTDGDPGRVHHVGIYCGGGDFIEAPATGETVRVSSLTDRIASRHDFVGGSSF